jgi:uncharacterized protein (DUF362 family)
MDRREFVRTTAVAAGALAGGLTAWGQEGKSRVVIAKDEGVTKDGAVVEEVLGRMVDAAVTALTGEADAAKAWGKLCSSDERIGLKPNGLGGPMLSTATALIHVCVERLRGIGVKTGNLVIWDQDPAKLIACGLEPGETWGVRCVPASVEWDAPTRNGSFAGQLTTVLTKKIDGYINLPIIKDHNLAGITGALKAHYGSISNPEAHHANGCDPYIADLYSLPAIRDKSRLILTDGTRATCEGGPQFNPLFTWSANLILAATDPVANDMQIWKIVDTQREANGLMPLEAVGRKPKSILTAEERGLGRMEEAEVWVQELTLG